MAFSGGSDPLSVLLVRATVAWIVLYMVLGISGVTRCLPSPKRYAALALGIPMGVGSYGLLGAIEHLPVGLAVVIFYTYPILVAIVSWSTGREPFRLSFALSLAVVFGGVILALDIKGTEPHVLGIALALIAAIMIAAMMTLNDLIRGGNNPQPITLHMLTTSFIGYAVVCLWTGSFVLPTTQDGWLGFIAAPIFYTFSIIFLFLAISIVGPVRTALVMMVEPVTSVLFGYLLLSQRLTFLQLVGITLVITTVVLVEVSKSGKIRN